MCPIFSLDDVVSWNSERPSGEQYAEVSELIPIAL
jgi:hypothetical protein